MSISRRRRRPAQGAAAGTSPPRPADAPAGRNPGTSRRLRTAQDVEPSLRAQVRAGDPDAFGVLFDECARAVYNLAFRMVGNWSAAEEVVSLTFLEAWRLRGTVQQAGESLRPWLLGIAVNVAALPNRAVLDQAAPCSGAGPSVSAAAQPWEARAAHAGPHLLSQINTAHT